MKYGLLLGMATLICLPITVFAAAQAPGVDSVIIANVTIAPGQTLISVPVYFVTHSDITHYTLPLKVESSGDIRFQGRVIREALTGWDDNWQGLNTDGSESIQLGFADLGGDDNPALNTNGRRVEVMDLTFSVNGNLTTHQALIKARIDQRAGSVLFGLADGIKSVTPIFIEGSMTVTNEILAKTEALPTEISLSQNFPNPFNPTTDISYSLPQAQSVSLTIFNVLGQNVRNLVSGTQEAGYHKVTWDGRNNEGQQTPSGTYFYRLEAGDFSQSMKMVMLK
jgi:hypothetical protein